MARGDDSPARCRIFSASLPKLAALSGAAFSCRATLHGVVFDILDASKPVSRLSFPVLITRWLAEPQLTDRSARLRQEAPARQPSPPL
jgi:hypothetical protein